MGGGGWGRGSGGRWVLLLAVVVTGSGCFGHVNLTAPPATAPLPARAKAYRALRPVSLTAELISDQGGTYGPFAQQLHLADGQSISYPDDLLPVVAPKSACAGAARAYLHTARVQHTLYLVGVPLFLVGLATATAGALSSFHAAATGTGDGSLSPAVSLGGVLIGVGIVLSAVGSWILGPITRDQTRRAFEAYDKGLQARLGLRVHVRTVDAPAGGSAGGQ